MFNTLYVDDLTIYCRVISGAKMLENLRLKTAQLKTSETSSLESHSKFNSKSINSNFGVSSSIHILETQTNTAGCKMCLRLLQNRVCLFRQ